MKKGFTLIELIVVIAVVGVLVLLAAPKFLGYTEKANNVLIQADIKTLEAAIDNKLVREPNFFDSRLSVSNDILKDYQAKAELYQIAKGTGVVPNQDNIVGKIYEVDSAAMKDMEFKSNLGGSFFYSEGEKKVYYSKVKIDSSGNDGGVTTPDPGTPEVPVDPIDPNPVDPKPEVPQQKLLTLNGW